MYNPRITEDVFLNGVLTSNALVALWSEKSAINMDIYTELCQLEPPPLFVPRCHRLLSAEMPQAPIKAVGVCAITIRIGRRQIWHFVSVVPQLHSSFLVGADLLVRLGTQVDTVNQVLWSQVSAERHSLSTDPAQMLSGQTIPQACQVASEVDMIIPPRTAGAPIRLEILKGQRIPGPQAFFQPLPSFQELNLAVCGTPLLEINHRTTYVLVQNPTHCPVQLKAHQVLGMLVDSSFHDFELNIPVIGELPPSLTKDGAVDQVLRTFPTEMITVRRHESLQDEAICGASLTREGDMMVYALATQPGQEIPGDAQPEELYPGFEAEIKQQLDQADALTSDAQRATLRKLFLDFQPIFSKDSTDCGVTNLHTVHIPTDPNALPTFVRQYKIPLAAYKSIQDIIDTLLKKQGM